MQRQRRFLPLLIALAAFTSVAPLANAKNPNPPEPTVYMTKTGSKYHNAGCRYLRHSSIAVPLSAAKAKGLSPCSVCHPPK